MTASGEFFQDDMDMEEAPPAYPVVFGTEITPLIGGLLIAVAGIAVAGYLFTRFVQPAQTQNNTVRQEVASKEALLVDPEEIRARIAEADTRLQQAEQNRTDVLALFASDDSLATLLLDLNERINAVNDGITDEERQAKLTRFELDPTQSGVITDGSLGAGVNNRLERRTFNVEIEGDFPQTQAILRSIERLQPLILVQDYQSELNRAGEAIVLDPQGRVIDSGSITRIETAFTLQVLLPAPEGTYEAANPTAAEEGAETEEGAEEAPAE